MKLFFILFFLASTLTSTTFAQEVNIYDQPKEGAKIIGNIDMSVGIIPIFTPKEGTWIKVGDPRNGNVGWLKSNDINKEPHSATSFTYTQRITNDRNGTPQHYQIIQYGNPTNLNNHQTQSMIQQMQAQQKETQQYLQNTIQDVMNNLNTLFQQQQKEMPIFMPIIVMPPKK